MLAFFVKLHLQTRTFLTSFSPAGFTNPGVASLLHTLGPQTASCNQQAIAAACRRYQLGCSLDRNSDTTIISKPSLSEEDVAPLSEVRGGRREEREGREGGGRKGGGRSEGWWAEGEM